MLCGLRLGEETTRINVEEVSVVWISGEFKKGKLELSTPSLRGLEFCRIFSFLFPPPPSSDEDNTDFTLAWFITSI